MKTYLWILDSGFGEELTTLILGSRKPILFVEGTNSSLDIAIYRVCFSDWTIIPKGSCEEVIHSVVTLRHNSRLTRIQCSGIVDADDYEEEDVQHLASLGVSTLPVSEIENIILMPSVSRAIAENEGYTGGELDEKLENLSEAIFNSINSERAIEEVVVRYCRRRIDRTLKKVDLSEAETIPTLRDKYLKETQRLDISEIAQRAKERITTAIEQKDLPLLLKNYDNKGMIALAASQLKNCKLQAFESWVVRVLRNQNVPTVVSAIQELLPDIEAQ